MTPSRELPRCSVERLRPFELMSEHVPLLQRFFDANPDYFLAVSGETAGPNEAHDEIFGQLPTGWIYTKQWPLGWMEPNGSLAAMANITSDLLAPGVWHIGLFIVASTRHGCGESQVIYRDVENWTRSNGAAWLRLGVVQGNARAERFWESAGFHETRKRVGVQMGKRTNTLRVMCKPLLGGSLASYLDLVHRDRPDTPNAL